MTTTISTISTANPAKCTMPSFSGGTRFLRTASMMRNMSLPPSSAGIGRRFMIPKFAVTRTPRFSIFRTTAAIPDGAAAW